MLLIVSLLAGLSAASAAGSWRDAHNELVNFEPSRMVPIPLPQEPHPVASSEDGTVQIIVNGGDHQITAGDLVKVEVINTGPRNTQQWVGAYSPPNAEINQTSPMLFSVIASHAPSYVVTGNATLHFRLYDTGYNYRFYYADCKSSAYPYPPYKRCVPAAVTAEIQVVNRGLPSAGRSVPAEDGQLRVLWTSSWDGVDAGDSERVQVSVDAGASWQEVTTGLTTEVIAKSQLCDGGRATTFGWKQLLPTHSVLLDHGILDAARASASQTLLWQVQRTGVTRLGPFELRPPLPAADTQRPTRIIAFGDLGRGTDDDAETPWAYGRPALNTTLRIQDSIESGEPLDLIYNIGDVSYAVGFLGVWVQFLNMVQPVAARAAWMLNFGNHEVDTPDPKANTLFKGTDSGGECGVLTDTLLPQPWASLQAPWFSYDVGQVHVVAMSTEHEFAIGSEQNTWLAADLAAVNRTETPWILFGGHRPMYIDSTYNEGFASDRNVANMLVTHIEPMLLENGVQVAIWGHNHAVQRHCAAFDHHCQQRATQVGPKEWVHDHAGAPVQMVIGTGGADFTVNNQHPPMETTESVFFKWGFADIMAHNATHMHWKWVEGCSGDVIEELWFIQDPGSYPDPRQGSPKKRPIGPGATAAIVVSIIVLAVGGVLAGMWYSGRTGQSSYADMGNAPSDAQPGGSAATSGAAAAPGNATPKRAPRPGPNAASPLLDPR